MPAGAVSDLAHNELASSYSFDFFVLTGDLNHDGNVSIADFITLASNFGKTNATFSDGDSNYDQQVTIADFIELASHFGQAIAGSAAPVPMAAESQEIISAAETGPLFAKARGNSHKATHHRKRGRLPRLARPFTPMFRRA